MKKMQQLAQAIINAYELKAASNDKELIEHIEFNISIAKKGLCLDYFIELYGNQ